MRGCAATRFRPPSSYPKIADGTLVPLHEYAFPAIPGVNRPHEANAAYRLDFGPNWRDGNSQHPAAEGRRAFPGARAPGRCRRQRTRRRALAGNHRSAGDVCRLESSRSVDRRARSARLLRGVVSCHFPRPPPIARRRAIRASRSRNAMPTAKTTRRATRTPWMIWSSNAGFCRKTARLAASRRAGMGRSHEVAGADTPFDKLRAGPVRCLRF